MSEAWRDRRFSRLRRAAERLYEGDLRKQNAAKTFIAEQKRAIEAEEYPAHEDPFQRLEDGLRQQYPEVWRDCGGEVLQMLREGQPGEA